MVPPVATPAASSPRLDRALPAGAWVVLVAALAAALARRTAVEQPAPAEGVRLWTLAPAAGGASQ